MAEAPEGAPHAAPHVQQEGRYGDRPHVHLQERPYLVGLLLSVVTLGFYGLWWHYATHDELCRQVGRKNEEKTLWGFHVGLYVVVILIFVGLVLAFVASLVAAGARGPFQGDAGTDAVARLFGTFLVGIALLVTAGVVQTVLFVIYVAKQYDLINEVRHGLGLPPKTGPGWFFGWYYGGALLFGFFGLPVLGPILAYINPQEHYNELYRHYAYARHPGSRQVPAGGPGLAGGSRTPSGAGTGTAYGDDTDPWASMEASPAATPTGEGSWDRQAERRSFRVKDDTARTATPDEDRQIEQAFKCPRCHDHVSARGVPGSLVGIRCTRCGEGGDVRLPEA